MMPTRATPAAKAIETRYVPSVARAGENMRQRILVLPFLDEKSNGSDKRAEVARASFISQLVNSNRLVVVRTSDLGKDIESFRGPEGYDLAAIAKLAGPNDIVAIIEASILDVQAKKIGDSVGVFRKLTAKVKADVRLRVFSTRSNKEVFSDLRTASVESSTRVRGMDPLSGGDLDNRPDLVRAAVEKALAGTRVGILRALDKMDWEGRIALIRGDRIYVNAGRLSGLQLGDILRVSSEGEEIYDPETGVFIGRAPGRPKGTVEVVSYFGKDGAVAVIHSGGGFEANDRVNLY